jgi:hypothetical protein
VSIRDLNAGTLGSRLLTGVIGLTLGFAGTDLLIDHEARREAALREADRVIAASKVFYRNCDEVRATGAVAIRQGDPGYGPHLDRDGDGVGCE